MKLQVSWVEVPVKNLERALTFYAALFEVEQAIATEPVRRTATLTPSDAGVGLSLNETANFEPSDHGPLIYLTTDDLDAALGKVTAAGGEVVAPKTPMGEWGLYAMFKDTEGNVLALYANV